MDEQEYIIISSVSESENKTDQVTVDIESQEIIVDKVNETYLNRNNCTYKLMMYEFLITLRSQEN